MGRKSSRYQSFVSGPFVSWTSWVLRGTARPCSAATATAAAPQLDLTHSAGGGRASERRGGTAMEKLRIVILRFGTARQKTDLE
jgi:hypothetical protein